MPITDFAAVYESAGLNTMSYSPASVSLAAADWPSLGEMIDKGTRLVTFVDNQADFASVPYLLDGMFVLSLSVIVLKLECRVHQRVGDSLRCNNNL